MPILSLEIATNKHFTRLQLQIWACLPRPSVDVQLASQVFGAVAIPHDCSKASQLTQSKQPHQQWISSDLVTRHCRLRWITTIVSENKRLFDQRESSFKLNKTGMKSKKWWKRLLQHEADVPCHANPHCQHTPGTTNIFYSSTIQIGLYNST